MKTAEKVSGHLSASLLLAAAMAIIGTVGAFSIEGGLAPIATVFWSCLFSVAFLASWCLYKGHRPGKPAFPRRLLMTAVAGVAMITSWVAYLASIEGVPIATATILYHLQPFFVVLLGGMMFGEKVRPVQFMWIGTGFAGLALASGLLSQQAAGPGWIIGAFYGVAAAVLYAVATLLGKSLGAQPPEVTALLQTAIGVVILAPLVDFSAPIPTASWGWITTIGIVHNGIAYVMMYAAYPRLNIATIGVLAFIYPLVAILVDWLVYAHPIDAVQACGMVVVVIATLAIELNWTLGLGKPAGLPRSPES